MQPVTFLSFPRKRKSSLYGFGKAIANMSFLLPKLKRKNERKELFKIKSTPQSRWFR
jgi:hypothetical protein